jgi:hypothetical protein
MDDNGKWKLVVMLVKKWQESRRIWRVDGHSMTSRMHRKIGELLFLWGWKHNSQDYLDDNLKCKVIFHVNIVNFLISNVAISFLGITFKTMDGFFYKNGLNVDFWTSWNFPSHKVEKLTFEFKKIVIVGSFSFYKIG